MQEMKEIKTETAAPDERTIRKARTVDVKVFCFVEESCIKLLAPQERLARVLVKRKASCKTCL